MLSVRARNGNPRSPDLKPSITGHGVWVWRSGKRATDRQCRHESPFVLARSSFDTCEKPRILGALIVGMFGFDLEFLLAGFADPMVLTVNERVVVNALAVVVRAQIALHHSGILSGFILARAFVRIRPGSPRPHGGLSLFLHQCRWMQQAGILRNRRRTSVAAKPYH